MSAYAIATYKVTDPDKLNAYITGAVPTIYNHGGKVLVASPPATTFEGEFAQDVVLVLEFESIEEAQGWYNSIDYNEFKHLRHESTITDFAVFVEQFEIPELS